MHCEYHPNVESLENCASCGIPLCGLCANYTEKDILCEKCVDNRETEQFVTAQAQQIGRPDTILQTEPEQRDSGNFATRKKSDTRKLPYAIISICLLLIGYQFYASTSPDSSPMTPEDLAQEQALTAVSQCLIVFRQIGEVLADSGSPPDNLRCSDSPAPNRVRNVDGDIRVSHPDPAAYGYSALYVSRNNPEPTLVD